MTTRNLDAIFGPKSIALIGAGERPHSVGHVTAQNLRTGGFAGPLYLVNPKHAELDGVRVWPDVASLPEAPDLAVICTPPASVPGLIAELGARGTRGAIVITAGFGELANAEGKRLQQAVLEAARPHLLRVVGPNCLGVMVPESGINASFAHIAPRPGDIAFVTQSGAMLAAVLDWAGARGIGFSRMVSLGDMLDVDFGDLLDYLAQDGATRSILLYIEGVTHARKFMSAARAAARLKPVVVIKAGRHAQSAKAAASHTGALAGADEVYDAAFRRAGMLRVFDLDELFAAVETLAAAPPWRGDRLAILTNGGGVGVLATDTLIDQGGRLAELTAATIERLNAVLPPTWSHGNPIDIIGDAPGSRYAAALEILLEAEEVDAILILNCPTAIASSLDGAQAVVSALGEKRYPVLTSWLGEAAASEARKLFSARRIPTFDTPGAAVRGFMHLVRYRRNQAMLMETPPAAPSATTLDVDAARRIVARALAEGRELLSEPEAKDLLALYGVPVARTLIARTPDEAAACAAKLGAKIAVKILSPDISHKSDVGGVVLDLAGPQEAKAAALAIGTRIKERKPGARIAGFTVQEMVPRSGAHELIVGLSEDRQFGPVILFGEGGTAVEVIGDKALALPPLNLQLARELMSRTRVYRLLQGYRDHPPAALDAIAGTLVQISQLACDFDEVVELDINPLLASPHGVVALDARVRVRPPSGAAPTARLAIRPYPRELEETVTSPELGDLRLRPVKPEDEPAFHATFARLTPEDIRMRFFAPLRTLSHEMAARLTQIDYDREMALVLERPAGEGPGEILGVARLAADPDGKRAEFAVIVRSDVKGQGLGTLLLERIIAYGRRRRVAEIFGDILAENVAMRQLCHELGFAIAELPESAAIVRATLRL